LAPLELVAGPDFGEKGTPIAVRRCVEAAVDGVAEAVWLNGPGQVDLLQIEE
jgi:hypothetical protein